jgi:hypothetical protein
MPLNESRGVPSRGNLTSQQKREAEIAIYGTPENRMPEQRPSPEELQQMRLLLAKFGQQSGPIKEFDLNKPPKEPYTHQEYPKLMYHATKKPAVAQDAAHQETLEAAGHQDTPVVTEDVPSQPALSAADAAEAAGIDAKLSKKRR